MIISFSQLGKVQYNEGVEGAGRFSFAYKEPLLVERSRPSTRLRQTTDSGSLYGATMIGIYKITSPSGRVYIGQSWNIEKRWFKYRSDVPDLPQPILHASFLKYGAKNHLYEVIHELPATCTQQEMDEQERAYIDLYKSRGFAMMNCREGGSAGRHNEATKRKISALQKGIRKANSGSFQKGRTMVLTQEHKDKISKALSGKKVSDETKKKIKEKRQFQKITHSDETKRKIGLAHLGKKQSEERRLKNGLRKIGNKYRLGKTFSEETRLKISNSRKGKYAGPRVPPIKVIDTKTGQIYQSINSVAKLLGISHGTLKLRLTGKYKTRRVLRFTILRESHDN